jgi:methionyl-tRNA synthetase
MEANGDLYLSRYEGWYSIRDEAYYDESELVAGRGRKLSPQGTPVEWTVEESWFFRLSAYGEKLLAHYRDNPDFIRPESRRNEMIAFVSQGLRDLSVSRTSFDWGVKVPGSENHVMYVGGRADQLPDRPGLAGGTAEFKAYWPANLHLIGKDIVRFHTIYWPFLMSAGLPLPRRCSAMASCSTGRRNRSRSATSPIRWRWPHGSESIRCAISSARSRVRAGRQLFAGSHRHPLQRRAGEQLWQPGPARSVHDLQEPGWRTWRVFEHRDGRCLAGHRGARLP